MELLFADTGEIIGKQVWKRHHELVFTHHIWDIYGMYVWSNKWLYKSGVTWLGPSSNMWRGSIAPQHHQGMLGGISCESYNPTQFRPHFCRGNSGHKESACNAGFDSWLRKISCRKKWQPNPNSCLGNPMDRGPGELQSNGLQRVGHDWEIASDSTGKEFNPTRPLSTSGTSHKSSFGPCTSD